VVVEQALEAEGAPLSLQQAMAEVVLVAEEVQVERPFGRGIGAQVERQKNHHPKLR
jgi:hypothetical protein